MKTRVAIVLPYFAYGGAEVMVSRLASHLDQKNIEAEVICIFGEARNNDLEKAIQDHGVPIHFIGKGKGFSASAAARLFRELDRFAPDIVHTHLSACVYCAPWVISRNRKMLHTVHNMPAHELIRPKRVLMRMMYASGYAVPVAISREIRTQTDQFYKLKKEPELIYNPVDVGRFAFTGKREEEPFTVLNVGRLSVQKNQQLLVRAFSQVYEKNSNTRLLILGDGPLRKDLQDLIEREGLKECVSLEGNVTNTEDYYAKANIFALSSVYEGLPLVVLEAMASSLPIVSTDVGGVKDLVSDNGMLVQEGDCEQLARALIYLMEHPMRREIMGARSYEAVQKYDSAEIAKGYSELYSKYSLHGA